ncbi:MAG: hypothetical protein NTZ69_09895 [Bacteroidia bacterium]|nr:hypothetical protein [Bacteroidia bacterium]
MNYITVKPEKISILVNHELSTNTHPLFRKAGDKFNIRYSEDSMAPLYQRGDILACRKIESIKFFQWGKVYILETSQGILVTRVFQHNNPDYIICVSDKKDDFPPFDVPIKAISSVGIVLGTLRMGDF